MKMKTLTDVLRQADPVTSEPRSPEDRAITRSTVLAGPRRIHLRDRPASRWRAVAVAAVLAAVAISTGVFAWRHVSVDAVAAMRFEARIEGSDEAIIDTHDILTAEAVSLHDKSLDGSSAISSFGIEVTFTPEGAGKMRAATDAHIGERLELLVDDKVVMAPVIRAAILSPAMLTGQYTRADAERIAEGLLKGKLVQSQK
jgi:preprotein translocase subunit SecD